MAKSDNSLGRLNAALFDELDRLAELDINDEEACRAEIERSRSIQGIAKEINESAKTIMHATRMRAEYDIAKSVTMPKSLEG